jgi:hypothetical protein
LCKTTEVLYVPSITTSADSSAFRVENRFEGFPLDLDRLDGAAGLRKRVGRNRRDCGAAVARFGLETLRVTRAERVVHPRQPERRRKVDLRHARVRIWRAQHRCMKHPGELDVRRVSRFAADALPCVLPHRIVADHRQRPIGPLHERIFLDNEPDLLEPALDLLLGADQSRQCRIASSIRG